MTTLGTLGHWLTRLAHGVEALIGLHPSSAAVDDSPATSASAPLSAESSTAAGEAPVDARAGSEAHAAAIRALAADVSRYWQEQVGEPVQPQELELLLALSGLETVWGLGWTDKSDRGLGDMRGSNNFGARQYSGPGASWTRVEYGDTRPPTPAEVAAGQTANIPIDAPFNYYVAADGRTAAENGAYYFVRDLAKTWDARDALRTGSAPAFAARLAAKADGGLGYFGGFGTTAEARIGGYANALASRLPEVAAALGYDKSHATVVHEAGAYANTATGKVNDARLGGLGDDVGAWLHGEWQELMHWLSFRDGSAGATDNTTAGGRGAAARPAGPLSDLRRRALDVIREVVPSTYGDERFAKLAPGWTPETATTPTGAFVTTCGYLPGYLGSRLGLERDLSSFGTYALRTNAQAWGAWVEPGGDARPRPGDAYALQDANGGIVHVGVVVSAPATGDWQTADAGQGSHAAQAAAYVDRPYDAEALTLGGPAGPRRLAGWVDMDKVPVAEAHPLTGLVS